MIFEDNDGSSAQLESQNLNVINSLFDSNEGDSLETSFQNTVYISDSEFTNNKGSSLLTTGSVEIVDGYRAIEINTLQYMQARLIII